MTQIYIYDLLTGEYESTRPAQVITHEVDGEIIEQELTEVSNGTTVPVPEIGENEVAIWNGTEWVVKEDHRQHYDETGVKAGGTPYWLPEDHYYSQPRYMEELGPLPDDAMLEAPAKTTEELFSSLRAKRDVLISSTDYLMTADYPISDENRAKVQAYRTALRDLPSQEGAPWDGGGDATPWPVLELD